MRISLALPEPPYAVRQLAGSPQQHAASNGGYSPEDELTFWLVGTAERRAGRADRVAALAERADWKRLAERLDARGLGALVGTRLMASPGVEAPESFARFVEATTERQRLRAALVESESMRVWRMLEGAGIRAAVVKGPLMGERLFGDVGLRRSGDVDLLVRAEEFHAAVGLLEVQGYTAVKGRTWRQGLPLFETTLQGKEAWRPPLDLHWRLHWNEEAFSRELLDRAESVDGGARRPAPLDELAMLLLIFARDGLWGLRAVADIAQWWDRFGHQAEAGALEPIARAHADVADSLAAALAVAERLGGVPAQRLLPSAAKLPRQGRTATRLASWQSAGESEYQAMVALIDLLLSPRGGRFDSVQRHLLPPPEVISRIYHVPARAPLRRTIGRVRFAVLVGARLLPRQARAIWATRGGRELTPAPPA